MLITSQVKRKINNKNKVNVKRMLAWRANCQFFTFTLFSFREKYGFPSCQYATLCNEICQCVHTRSNVGIYVCIFCTYVQFRCFSKSDEVVTI